MNHITAPVITLDGPSGTGKGTLCHKLADYLKWNILDSGCIYRVLAYALYKKNIAFNDLDSILAVANQLKLRFELCEGLETKVFLEDEDVSGFIRTEQCGQSASKIAAIPEVREALLARQRAFARPPGLVTDGRDMGTVVFKNAILKIFLYANPEERAKRRYLQLKKQGIDGSLPEVVQELIERDTRDAMRLHAPLKPAEDAVLIDTSHLTVLQTFDSVLKLINEHEYFKGKVSK